jgi:hypothetical protein
MDQISKQSVADPEHKSLADELETLNILEMG